MASSPLLDAIQGSEMVTIKDILTNSNPVITHRDMQEACWQGRLPIFTLLYDHGGSAHLHAKDPQNGRTLLHEAAFNCGNTAVCVHLVELGLSLTAKDNEGRTPLQYADDTGDTKMAKALQDLSKGISPSAPPAAPSSGKIVAKPKAAISPPPSAPAKGVTPAPPKPAASSAPKPPPPPGSIPPSDMVTSYTPWGTFKGDRETVERKSEEARKKWEAEQAEIRRNNPPPAAYDEDDDYGSSSSGSSRPSRPSKEKKVCGSCRGSGTSQCKFCGGSGQFQKKRCTHCKGGVNKCISCNGKG